MTTKPTRKIILYRPNEYQAPKNRWIWWQHTPAAILLISACLLLWFIPAEYSEFAGLNLISPESALYLRGGITLFAVIAVIGVRGQPWWSTLIGTLVGLGMSMMLSRSIQSSVPMPLGQMLVVMGVLGFILVQLFRPSVYERLEERIEQIDRRDRKIEELEKELQRVGRQSKHFERLYYELRGRREEGLEDRRAPVTSAANKKGEENDTSNC